MRKYGKTNFTCAYLTHLRLLHKGDLLRCYRDSGLVTYVSTLPAHSPSAPCISSFLQHLQICKQVCENGTSCKILHLSFIKILRVFSLLAPTKTIKTKYRYFNNYLNVICCFLLKEKIYTNKDDRIMLMSCLLRGFGNNSIKIFL